MEHDTILRQAGHDPRTRDGSCLSRRIFLKGVGIACLGIAPFLQACDTAFSREGNERTRTASVSPSLRPPIDLFAPTETRMATFALG
jgi:hypothetical protein